MDECMAFRCCGIVNEDMELLKESDNQEHENDEYDRLSEGGAGIFFGNEHPFNTES